ncbi:LytR/AlgR family response regulator transcription factor [Pontimicrobium sp. IMCC45349]|uniref:LytR/AlgR family response regulator transcription factor n=1 Tax=Pontimicrobium sp. IMCC45349 TaxID=3391574 RepID=UPI0039A0C095
MSRLIIFEDEPAALQRLTRMIKEIRPQYTVVGTSDNINDAAKLLENFEYDLILSDIELSDGNCFEVFKKINPEKPIIFVTAYNDYAIKAFEFNGIHYLLKPINYQALTKALVKFEKHKIDVNNLRNIQLNNQFQIEYQKRIISKVGQKLKVIETNNIALFFTETGVVYANTYSNTTHALDDTLEHLYQKLNPDLFFRINRQMIVHINAVVDMIAYSSNRLKLKLKVNYDKDIVVSKDRVTAFKNWLASH